MPVWAAGSPTSRLRSNNRDLRPSARGVRRLTSFRRGPSSYPPNLPAQPDDFRLMRGPEPAIMSPAVACGPVGFPPWNPTYAMPVASVAELAYAPGLGPGVRKDVEVRLLSLALCGAGSRGSVVPDVFAWEKS
jgi:hypothetical protein